MPELRSTPSMKNDHSLKNKPMIASAKTSKTFINGSLAFAISTALIANVGAEEVNLDALVVEDTGTLSTVDTNPYAQPGASYKAKKVSDAKRTRDIADTPSTLTVLTKDAIDDSGKTELKDILSAQPGITLGTGEGGNSFGDRYIIRGYEARSDVFTDGLREPGLISRDTFAIEQLEISKGPSSTFAGRGSTGGAINSVTKKASLEEDFLKVSGGLGSDNYQRYTIDGNKMVTEDLAIRANLLYGETDVPDRAPAGEKRMGALLSTVYQATDEAKISADYYHYESDDTPDLGTRLVDGEPNAEQGYPGNEDLDFLQSKADIVTATLDLELSDEVRFENKSRFGVTKNDYVATTLSVRNGVTSDRTFTGSQENQYIGNQTNFIIDTELGGRRHTIITGIELANEESQSATYTVSGNSATKNDIASDYELNTASLYIMDTVTINDDWEIFAGLRYDYFQYELWLAESVGRRGVTPESSYDYSDGLLNGHIGIVYSPWENGNIYANWSTSSNINGGESDAKGSCGYGGVCSDADGNYKSAEPEQTTNLELGTKWNVMDEKLLLTAAIFQITKDDVIEGGNDSYTTGGSLNTGKNRVRGVEFGVSGNLTDKLSAQFGLALMDSETLESYDADSIGDPKANFANESANLQLRYQVMPKFAFGGNVTYSSEMYGGQPDAGATDNKLPSYAAYDLFASYQVTSKFEIQANVQNVTDEDYYTALYRGGSIVYVGDARTANVTLNYQF
tara:strand:- start:1418 stop:3634 length:2217 start_codon:yes stop_codon:yes gene_type:complete